MFKDFSFPPSAKGRSFRSSSGMESSVSPTSSRGTSPGFEDIHARRPSASFSVDELSQRFGHHNLDPRRPHFCPDAVPSQPRNVHPSTHAQRSQNPTHDTSHLWQQRQALARQQSAPNYSLQQATIHEGRLSNDRPSYDTSHPSSPMVGNFSQSQWRDGIPHASSPFATLPLSPPYSEDSESDPAQVLRTQHTYKIVKELRQMASRDAMPKQRVVLKKIRRRKSSLRRAAAAERP